MMAVEAQVPLAGKVDDSLNPTIFNIINTLGRWDKRLIDQASDVPSIIFFFIISYKLRALKTLYFYFCNLI